MYTNTLRDCTRGSRLDTLHVYSGSAFCIVIIGVPKQAVGEISLA